MTRLRAVGAVAILVATVLVAVGVGQGSPPPRLPITRAAERREVAAVAHGSALVRRGEALFQTDGCAACHTLAAGGYGGRLGPRLDVESQGDPVGEIEAHIADPPHSDPHYEPGLMPENFASRFSQPDLHALATFVHAAAQAAAGTAAAGH